MFYLFVQDADLFFWVNRRGSLWITRWRMNLINEAQCYKEWLVTSLYQLLVRKSHELINVC